MRSCREDIAGGINLNYDHYGVIVHIICPEMSMMRIISGTIVANCLLYITVELKSCSYN